MGIWRAVLANRTSHENFNQHDQYRSAQRISQCEGKCGLVSSGPCYFAVFTLDAGLLAISQYSVGPATGHLDTGFSWFPCVYEQMLR